MGKQAKKKQRSDSQMSNQRNHNRGTRGVNTKRRPCVWETREEIYKDKDGNTKIRTVKVEYPPNLQWDWTRLYDTGYDEKGTPRLMRRKADNKKGLHPPLDTLIEYTMDEDIAEYAKKHSAKIEKTPLANGRFLYEIWHYKFNQRLNKQERCVILTVNSPHSVRTLKKKKKFSRKKK